MVLIEPITYGLRHSPPIASGDFVVVVVGLIALDNLEVEVVRDRERAVEQVFAVGALVVDAVFLGVVVVGVVFVAVVVVLPVSMPSLVQLRGGRSSPHSLSSRSSSGVTSGIGTPALGKRSSISFSA